jgi:cholesterol transport system auxiliary component
VTRRAFAWGALLLAATLAACSAIPDKPVRATLYDFGPAQGGNPAAALQASLPALVLADVETTGALDGSAVLYRLGYADDHQLRPYSQARWSAPPPQLIRQRLRQRLGRERAVLDLGESAGLARDGGTAPRVLRMGLEEFSHLFESESRSWGLLRLRVTLLDNTVAGEQLLAQRTFVVRKPAPTADAPGGVRALTAATDAAAEEIAQWMQGLH